MIRTLQIRDLGPIARAELAMNSNGSTTIVGPSAVGKSSLIDAITFCLWGLNRHGKSFPAESISGEDVHVEIVTGSGSRIARTMTPARKITRAFNRAGQEPIKYDSEDAFRAALGPFGRDVKALLLIVSPEAWVPLALGDGGGRPLRDVIASVGPSTPIRARVAALMAAKGLTLLDRDPADSLDPKAAELARTNANRRRDEAAGSLKAVRERLATTEAPATTGPTPEAVAAARDVLAAVETWRAYLAAKSTADAAVKTRADAVTRHADWKARAAKVPPADQRVDPKPIEADLAALRAKLTAVEADPDFDDATAKVHRYTEQLAEAERAPGSCPTCKRPLPDDGGKAVELAKATLASAASYLAAIGTRDARRATRRGMIPEEIAALEVRRDAAKSAAALVAGLGAEPTIPPEVATPPEPSVPRPVNAKAEAEATIAAAERAKGADDERAKSAADARRNVETAEKAAQLATSEAERMDGLVVAIRAAPSAIAEDAIESLGDTSPFSIELEPAGGARVRVDKWDFQSASTGRLIAGDFAFRLGLRRALGVPTLPIFVDSVQSAGCELAEVEGPVIFLRTDREATGLTVER